MIADLASAGAGLIILLAAGDLLVRGAVGLALRLGIPSLVVGLTVVAFGTSAPELLVAVQAVAGGAPGLALGNIVGSNIANVLLVLGLPALAAGLNTGRINTSESYATMLVATAVFIALAFAGPLAWWSGLILLAGLGLTLWRSYALARSHRAAAKIAAEAGGAAGMERPGVAGRTLAIWLALGLIGLPLGADLLVDGAVGIARDLGIGEAVIGLTLVAIGTSLPELATTVMAALRHSAGVALGSVIGSNLFNLLGIAGVASLVGPIPVDPGFLRFDLWVMLGASILLAPTVFNQRDIGRWTGGLFVAGYAGYVIALVV